MRLVTSRWFAWESREVLPMEPCCSVHPNLLRRITFLFNIFKPFIKGHVKDNTASSSETDSVTDNSKRDRTHASRPDNPAQPAKRTSNTTPPLALTSHEEAEKDRLTGGETPTNQCKSMANHEKPL